MNYAGRPFGSNLKAALIVSRARVSRTKRTAAGTPRLSRSWDVTSRNPMMGV